MGQGNFPRRHYPDRVLGYSLSPTAWSTPVSIFKLEHFGRHLANGKFHGVNLRRGAKKWGCSAPEEFKDCAVGIELRYCKSLHFCCVVRVAQCDGFAGMRQREKCFGF